MSGPQYFALIARDKDALAAWQERCREQVRDDLGFAWSTVGERVALAFRPGDALAIGQKGFVIGPVFGRGSLAPLRVLDGDAAKAIVASRGQWLIRAYWGAYVAFIASDNGNSIDIVRGPLGDLTCLTAPSPFGLMAASDVALLEDLGGFVARPNWPALARHLITTHLHSRATCLEGLDELAGGSSFSDGPAGCDTHELWSPWDWADPAKRLDDPAEAAQRVCGAVKTAVRAQAAMHQAIVLKLSGGLDSSIVAACLAESGTPATALTLVTRDPAGDERGHARAVAAHLGIDLVEAHRDPAMVDLCRSEARDLPRPTACAFTQPSSMIARNVARDVGAKAVFDGGGGDNVFASLQSPAPATDCLHDPAARGLFWATARSIGVATRTSTIEVARRALIRKWTRGPGYRWARDDSLLTGDALALTQNALDHPWLRAPTQSLAGSAAHVALLAAAQSVTEARDVLDTVASVSPLISQPVAEACLRVPSWLWTRDGHDRAIARDAFKAVLPASIVERRDKGAPDSFMVELLEDNFELVRSMLLDGVLVRHGLVDAAAVAAAMNRSALFKGFGYVRLMQLVDTEAWAMSWTGR